MSAWEPAVRRKTSVKGTLGKYGLTLCGGVERRVHGYYVPVFVGPLEIHGSFLGASIISCVHGGKISF